MKYILVLLFNLSFILLGVAQKKVATIFSTNDGAIGGYDPVAYFTQSKPVKGEATIVYNWKGADWHFSSEANRDMFSKNPDKYAPQYGGWCAYGWAQGYPAKIDPVAWSIVSDKLYLNYNLKVQKDWNNNQKQFISQADKNYAKIQTQ